MLIVKTGLRKIVPLKIAMEEPIVLESESMGSDTRKRRIPCRRELLIMSLQRFYSTCPEFNNLIPILKGEADISLRLIDWFVTNYAKKHHVSYVLTGQEFVVYLNYKSQLKAFSKKLFDPFCRRERILFQCGTYEPFETTVGQLNFFRWAFEKNILNYIREHYSDIVREEKQARTQGTQSSTDSMNTTVSSASTLSVQSSVSISTSSSKTTRRRRTEKIQAASKMMHKHDLEIKLSFD
jgi:hypothetical protein